jgi:hypothetical protein
MPPALFLQKELCLALRAVHSDRHSHGGANQDRVRAYFGGDFGSALPDFARVRLLHGGYAAAYRAPD